VDTISRNAHAQNQLISDILDVSRIIAGKVRLDVGAVDVASVVETAIDTLKLAAVAKKVHLESDVQGAPLVVSGDGSRIQQVVWNLLANAVKFAPRDGHVRLSVRSVADDIEIVVEDDGPGIPAAFLPYVFDRFRQADSSSTRPKGGLGLGLAIVRHFVELHGGSVSAANRTDGRGARFTVRLPHQGPTPALPAEKRAALAVGGPATRSLHRIRVLVVDDEEDARDLVATVLGRAGAEVLTAVSVAEALAVIARDRPQILVADVEMPGEDGYSLMRRVRGFSQRECREIAAVALTAYAGQEDRLKALAAGFQIHVAKPVEPDDLLAVVAGLAGRLDVSRL
jgi:CheY-like chemotaxis protein/anti-sigma regulatory factor (Ser/Thr protein kinase)